ncbi:uncharacterized protein LOC120086784 [Benincasa hispida]|uniref:uncharacterized protein LOC120086784 n=1 Tax=Benincasa hispida TaxID=102211 RepID=UPI0018FFB607|nr:uncharacterized protein LOC120086784 [Benincasa hispida]
MIKEKSLHMASTVLFLLILIPSLKILINGFNPLSTLVICLFLKAPPYIIISFLKAIQLSGEACLSAFQSLAEALKCIFVSTIEMGLGILSSLVMAVLDVVFGSLVESGSAFGGLLENAKASWEGALLEQVREIIGSLCELILQKGWEIATSSAGGIFEFVTMSISTLLNEPGSAIGELVGMLKESLMEGVGSSMEGVRGIVGSFIEKMANTSSEVASSSTFGFFEIVKTVFDLVVNSGYTVGGLIENTRAALEVLRMEEIRGIFVSLAKLGVNAIITYLLG